MFLFLAFLSELILLYLISDRISRILYTAIYSMIKNQYVATGLITLIYLPGTAVHELAHLISAEVLRVPTGELSFTPEFTKNDEGQTEIQSGSLKIASTDPFRRYLIGFAPVIFGLAVLMLLVWLFQYFWPQALTQLQQIGLICLIGYLLFAVSNSMFASHQDTAGFWPVLIVLILIAGAAYITGLRITLTGQILQYLTLILTGLTKALAIVIGVNLLLFIISSLLLSGIRRIIK